MTNKDIAFTINVLMQIEDAIMADRIKLKGIKHCITQYSPTVQGLRGVRELLFNQLPLAEKKNLDLT